MMGVVEIRLAREKLKLYQTIRNIFIVLTLAIFLLTISGVKFGWLPINFVLLIGAVISAFKQHFHADDYARLLHLENRMPLVTHFQAKKYFTQSARLIRRFKGNALGVKRLSKIKPFQQLPKSGSGLTVNYNDDTKKLVKDRMEKHSEKEQKIVKQLDLLN